MQVGDLVRYKCETLASNPAVLVVAVTPGIEGMVVTINPSSGFRAARWVKQLEVISESW